MQHLKTEIMAICDYALVSKEGKVSIIGIFDEVRADQFPTGLAKGFLVATLSGVPNKAYSLNLKLVGENKEEIFPALNMDLVTSDSGRSNIIIELVGTAFNKEGTYKFNIYQGDTTIGTTELKVIHVKENKKQATAN